MRRTWDKDRWMAPDIDKVTELLRSEKVRLIYRRFLLPLWWKFCDFCPAYFISILTSKLKPWRTRVEESCNYFKLVQILMRVDERNPLSSTLMQLFSVLVWPGYESWENSRFSTLINSHATLVLVWQGYESWENSHANSRFLTLINSHATLVLVWQGYESWENSHANSRFSTLINSHATLVLVWQGYESWENSHANSRFLTLINSHATLVLVWQEYESWENSHANSCFSTPIIVWPGLNISSSILFQVWQVVSPFIDSYMAARSTRDLESRPSSPTGYNIAATINDGAQHTQEMDVIEHESCLGTTPRG
jgi:hypothetical protein